MNKKVLIVFSSHRTLESGGVGTHLRHLINEVAKSDYKYHILLGTRKSLLYKRAFLNLVDTLFRPSKEKSIHYLMNMIFCLSEELDKLLSKIADENTEFVIHCHERVTTFAAGLLKRKYNLKIVQTIHAPFAEQYEMSNHLEDKYIQEFTKIIEPGLTLEADYLIAVDILQQQIIENKFSNINLRMKEITNSVDTSIKVDENSYVKEKYGISDYIVVARHLYTKNGVEYAIRAFAMLKNVNYGLFIVGDGLERKNLEDLTTELGLEKRVHFLGRQPHKISLNIIAHAKLSLVPSIPVGIYIEAASLTMLESMLLGTPVVASNIGGLKQVLTNNVTGILVEPQDVETLAVSVDNLLADDKFYSEIQKNAKQLVLKEYNAEKWFSKISDIYKLV